MQKTVDIPGYWQRQLIALFVLLLVFVWFFAESWLSIVSIWQRSETYAHGFLVLPASLWLIWTRKNILKNIKPGPSYLALVPLLGFGAIWLISALSQVLVVEQFALVAVLISIIWVVLGSQVAFNSLFPLLFLFLMVPFGEDLVPYLMEYTASFVVFMLRLTDISVYREGLHFTLTSGQWSVVDACSGIRYLIASFTLGLVYAYINYSSHLKRAIFILLSILVPILANGIRAYMIVMIGHLSSMKLATGVDHIIYGWVFFGLVMLLLFYVGSFWQDRPAMQVTTPSEIGLTNTAPTSKFVSAGLITLFCVIVWPIAADELKNKQMVQASIPSDLLKNADNLINFDPEWGWHPEFKGVLADSLRFVKVDDQVAGVYFANFGAGAQGGELVNSQNTLIVPGDRRWRIIDSGKISVAFPGQSVVVEESALNGHSIKLLVFRWYRIGGHNTANPYYAKWLQLRKRLTGDASPELMVVLYTKTQQGDYLSARERLKKVAAVCCG